MFLLLPSVPLALNPPMLTIEDITAFFQTHSCLSKKSPEENSQKIPVIEAWVGVEKKGRTVIKGRLHGHPQHPLGVKMMTSAIQRHFAGAGRVYVKTKNSLYELGQPLNELELLIQISDSQNPEKITIWDC